MTIVVHPKWIYLHSEPPNCRWVMFSSLSLWKRRHACIDPLLSCINGKTVHFFRFWRDILSLNNKSNWRHGDKTRHCHWCPCLCLVLYICVAFSLLLLKYTLAAVFSLEKKPAIHTLLPWKLSSPIVFQGFTFPSPA